MKTIRFQKKNGVPVPFDNDDTLLWSEYRENQITTHKVTGVKKQRSYIQLKMFHGVIRSVAENSENPSWNTPEKVKFSLKVALHFVDDGVTVVDKQGNVHFQYRSFGYEGLRHMEACKIFDRSWPILAEIIGVSVEELLDNPDD